MEADLTAEQAECVNRALAGHNFAIVGEGGAGKSFVFSEICRVKLWSVQVVCSMGIACDVFKELSACSELKPVTVHSFIGVGTGQAPFDVLVSRVLNNPLVKHRLQEVNFLVWDECAMSSARLFELYYTIAQGASKLLKPFGGLQTIIVGDWLQLQPDTDRFDKGIMMFKVLLRSKLHVTNEAKTCFLGLTRYGCTYVCHQN